MSLAEARRIMAICTVCNYCNGFCETFRAAERRRDFSDGDLVYLAHLCHNCGNCLPACQYAPPHALAVNVPQTLAEVQEAIMAEIGHGWQSLAFCYHRLLLCSWSLGTFCLHGKQAPALSTPCCLGRR